MGCPYPSLNTLRSQRLQPIALAGETSAAAPNAQHFSTILPQPPAGFFHPSPGPEFPRRPRISPDRQRFPPLGTPCPGVRNILGLVPRELSFHRPCSNFPNCLRSKSCSSLLNRHRPALPKFTTLIGKVIIPRPDLFPFPNILHLPAYLKACRGHNRSRGLSAAREPTWACLTGRNRLCPRPDTLGRDRCRALCCRLPKT
jgi:hypothetical protein